jgi:hypothetical protein
MAAQFSVVKLGEDFMVFPMLVCCIQWIIKQSRSFKVEPKINSGMLLPVFLVRRFFLPLKLVPSLFPSPIIGKFGLVFIGSACKASD